MCYWPVTSTTRIEQGGEKWPRNCESTVALWESSVTWTRWWWWWRWKAACIASPSPLCSRLYGAHLHQNNTFLIITVIMNLEEYQSDINLQSLWLMEETSIDWLLARICAWFSVLCRVASMLLPKLLPSCSRFICRITAVALNACCERRRWVPDSCCTLHNVPVYRKWPRSLIMKEKRNHSPSIWLWQSFSSSAGWLTHECSYKELCLQLS